MDTANSGDEIVVTNGVYAAGGRPEGTNTLINRVAVDKPLALRSVNGPEFTVIQGYQAPGTTNGESAIRCVYLTNGASLVGFTLTNGATRPGSFGFDIPENSGGGVYCASVTVTVSNCVLIANSADQCGGGAHGGTLINCILSRNSARLGGGAYGATLSYCTLTTNTAVGGGGASSWFGTPETPLTLNHCILSGNSASGSGGGAAWGTLNHCTLAGNSAGSFGGGADTCTLNYCTLSGNSTRTNGAYGFGGGAIGSTLNQCLVIGNSAKFGGGTWSGELDNCTLAGNSVVGGGGCDGPVRLTNCVVYYNTDSTGANANFKPNYLVYPDAFASHCCTTPQPTNGVGNITNPPLFVDPVGGNFHLQPLSPCINAGNNAAVSGSTDLDGNARIVGGTVDIGAYEFQSPQSSISYAWLQQSGLPTDGIADYSDSDGDGHNAWQEWRADTIPTNALSALRMLSPTSSAPGVAVSWESVNTRSYWLERASNLAGRPAFSIIASNLSGQPTKTIYTDTNAIGSGPFFYRVGVQP